jgi:hypothetical protein
VLPMAGAAAVLVRGQGRCVCRGTSSQPVTFLLQALWLQPQTKQPLTASSSCQPSGESMRAVTRKRNEKRIHLLSNGRHCRLWSEQRTLHMRLTATKHEIRYDGTTQYGNVHIFDRHHPHTRRRLLLFPSHLALVSSSL